MGRSSEEGSQKDASKRSLLKLKVKKFIHAPVIVAVVYIVSSKSMIIIYGVIPQR